MSSHFNLHFLGDGHITMSCSQPHACELCWVHTITTATELATASFRAKNDNRNLEALIAGTLKSIKVKLKCWWMSFKSLILHAFRLGNYGGYFILLKKLRRTKKMRKTMKIQRARPIHKLTSQLNSPNRTAGTVETMQMMQDGSICFRTSDITDIHWHSLIPPRSSKHCPNIYINFGHQDFQ